LENESGADQDDASRLEGEMMMNPSFNQGSAKIYQFPAGGRAALGGRRQDETKPAVDQGSLRVHEAACGDGWYHEAAIQDSKPAWER
jgi:Protein of unknown function (DUF2735)